MSDCYTYYRFQTLDEFGKEDEITYFCDVEFKGVIERKHMRNRRLSGFCQELFYFPDSTTREFWDENFAQDLETYRCV